MTGTWRKASESVPRDGQQVLCIKELKNGSKAPSASGTLSHETGPVTVTYTNVPGGLIPGVGGTGTTLFYVLGLILLLGGGSALVLTGRRRRRANSAA